ncbi:MAG TPA: molecular chaperone HtpG [Trebonia sp.]|nr:molecular chaperone HtpG [Trebonia sp.]
MSEEQPSAERRSFQAEVVQLLDLMIHSLYSNKEIFLRELISNSSDAIDRLRFASLTQPELLEDSGAPKGQIRVGFDKDARTITVSDNGIGMSRQEVIDNIGTIAKSGTREFLAALSGDQRKDAALIGQFGVGFYSAFIVADRVTLTTRRAGLPSGEAVRWESDGRGEYSLEQADRQARGTELTLHLREGEADLLNAARLREIIGKYSDHIGVPIIAPDETGGESVANRASALWARPRSEVTEQEYNDFYKQVAHDFADPLAYVHARIEGTYEYTLLLYIPRVAPFDLWMPEARRGVRLHVQRVFIMDDAGKLLPGYLRFVRGVIDSADLPLNVSREILQGSRVVDSIRSTAVKRILRLLADLPPDKYAVFYKEFGAVLKEGAVEDRDNAGDITPLLRFTTTKSAGDEPDVSLADYTGRMKDGQEVIYYLLAPSLAAARRSPHLELFRDKDVEVLLLTDPVDHWLVTGMPDVEGKRLQSVAEGTADLGGLATEEDKKAAEEATERLSGLTTRLKDALGESVTSVRVTNRLTTSPACIVTDLPDFDPLRRLRDSGLPSRPVLEINPDHPVIQQLNLETDADRFADWAHVLRDQAVLTLGARVDDPMEFAERLNRLLVTLSEK